MKRVNIAIAFAMPMLFSSLAFANANWQDQPLTALNGGEYGSKHSLRRPKGPILRRVPSRRGNRPSRVRRRPNSNLENALAEARAERALADARTERALAEARAHSRSKNPPDRARARARAASVRAGVHARERAARAARTFPRVRVVRPSVVRHGYKKPAAKMVKKALIVK